jgi:integrase
MAVRKLKSGKWVADVTAGVKWDGSRDRRVETCQTKGQARKAETRLLMEKERLRGRVTARITLAEFVDEVYWPQKAGLRKGEVLALRWEDVDLARRELTVRGTYTQGLGGAHETDPKNRNARRTIPLRAYAAERMAAWGPGEGPIVEGVGGGLLSPVTAGERMRRFTAGSYPALRQSN